MKSVIRLKRNDEFSMRKLYESICEELIDSGKLEISREDDHEEVRFTWELEEKDPDWIVRCKDCTQHGTSLCPMEDAMYYKTPDDWYCTDGRRREE